MSGSGANLPVRIEVEGAPQAEAQFNQVANAGSRAMQRVGAATTEATQSTGRFGQVVGQAGFQIQDFAGQVSAGQSALVAFSQQGSQMLGVFGTGGAVAGAVLTVGILAYQLATMGQNSDEAAEGVDALAKAMERAARDAERLTALLDRVNARFLATIQAARVRTQRDITADNTALGAETQTALMRLADADRELAALRAEAAGIGPRLADQNDPFITSGGAMGAADMAALRRRGDEVRGLIESTEAEIRSLQGRIARFDALRQRNEGLLAGLVADSSADVNLGPAPETPREGGRSPAAAGDPEGTLARLRAQQARELQVDIDRLTQSVETPLERYQRRIEGLHALALRAASEGNPIPEETIRRATDAAQADLDRLTRSTDRAADGGRELGFAFSSAFEDAIIKGEELSKVLQGLAADLAKIILRQSVTQPLANAVAGAVGGINFGEMFGFGGGVPVGGGNPSIPFGGPRAEGGPVFPGRTYLVGERGPELLTMGSAGSVTPNRALGGGDVSLTLNIDARGAGPREVDTLRAQIPAIARAAVQDAMRRGGGFARDVRGG